MIERIHGKYIDIAKLKKPVLSDIEQHLEKICSIVDYLSKNERLVEQNSCYICGGTARVPLTEIHGFNYFTCSNCSHVYTSNRYSDDAIRRFYEKNSYWAEVTYANNETCHYRRNNVALPKVEFVERYMNGGGALWLDVGSGIGDIVSVALERGHQAVGLELSETSVAFAKKVFGVDLSPMTLNEYLVNNPSIAGSMSIVSMIGLIEHVVSPIDFLHDANRVLRPGGLIMIQVPNARSLSSMIQERFPKNVFRHMLPIEHIMVFTESSINTALGLTGFEPVAYWYHGLDIYELMTNLFLASDKVHDSRLQHVMLEMMNDLQQVIDDRELSDRIICVARKTN